MKTPMSRFHIHDDLTAPEASLPILRGALASTGQLPNLIGVLAGAPAALRGYARFRSELRHGTLPVQTLERIALAVAHLYGSAPGLDLHRRTARRAGMTVDDVTLATEWDSLDPRDALLLRWLRIIVADRERPPAHLHEEVREAGWTEEHLLEALAVASVESLAAMVNVAGDVPADGSHEHTRLRAA